MPQRRKTKDDEVRIALLEEVSRAHERRIISLEEFQREIAERLDQKIQLDATTNIQMERALTRVITALEQLVEHVKGVSAAADGAEKLASAQKACTASR